jgi:hypothetical protein
MEDLTFEDANGKEVEVYDFQQQFVLYIYFGDGESTGAYLNLDKAMVLQQKLNEWIAEKTR